MNIFSQTLFLHLKIIFRQNNYYIYIKITRINMKKSGQISKPQIDGLKKFEYDPETGQYYLPGSAEFFIQQKKKYPNMADLYRDQLVDLLKGYSKEIQAYFPTLCQP